MTGPSTCLGVFGVSVILFLSSSAVHAQAAISDDTALIESVDANSNSNTARGQAHLSAGNFAEAEAEFTRALAQKPSKEEKHTLYWARGSVRMQLQNNAGAIDDFSSALKIAEAAQIYHGRARAHFALEQFDQANSDLASALGLGLPAGAERAKAYELRGYIFLRQGEYAAAIDAFTSAIEINPAPSLYFHRANLLRATGNTNAAYADYRQVVGNEKSPASMATQSFLELAFIYHSRQDVLNAMAAYDAFFAALANADDQTRELGAQVVQSLVKTGLYSGAAKSYDSEFRNALAACVKSSTCNP